MKATLMYGAGDVRIADVPDPAIHAPADAIVRVVRAAICGGDLRPYRSMPATDQGRPMGHEFLAILEDTGAEVTGLKRGDLVLSPFTSADNTCFWCRRGLRTSCPHGRPVRLRRRGRRPHTVEHADGDKPTSDSPLSFGHAITGRSAWPRGPAHGTHTGRADSAGQE
jgi:threonine dehydrogenase-like Zn-dependent dehydrogenase